MPFFKAHKVWGHFFCMLFVSAAMLLLFTGCGVDRRAEVIFAEIGRSMAMVEFEDSEDFVMLSTLVATITLDVYGCEDIQAAIERDESQEWFSEYAHCYNDDEELELQDVIIFEKKEERKNTAILNFIVDYTQMGTVAPDESSIGELSFSFTLSEFETSYDGEFTTPTPSPEPEATDEPETVPATNEP